MKNDIQSEEKDLLRSIGTVGVNIYVNYDVGIAPGFFTQTFLVSSTGLSWPLSSSSIFLSLLTRYEDVFNYFFLSFMN